MLISATEPTPEEEARNIERWKAGTIGLSIPDFRESTFEKYLISDTNRIAFEMMKNWSPEKEFGIMLCGSCGTGKTHLLKALAIRWVSYHCRPMFRSLSSIFDTLRANFEDIENQMAKFKMCDLLMIDDFGAEKRSEFSEDKLTQILDYRIYNRKKTFMSSNLLEQDILNKYHPRVFDRLKSLMLIVHLNGDSYRDKIQERFIDMISEKGYPQ